MTKTIANNVQNNFIFAINELEAEIVRLNRVISEKQIFSILEKLKLFYKLEEKFISFSCDDDEELSWNFEGPAFCYA